MSTLIQEGEQVIFRRDKSSGVFQVKTDRPVYFEKAKFKLDAVIGEPFGSTFQVNNGQLVRISDPDKFLEDMMEGGTTGEVDKDNRDLIARGDNQKLSQEDILKMKEDGACGTEIVKKLVSNSETFDNKTKFSQRKYLNKKLKKHVHIFTALKPTARLLIDLVYNKNPEKIGCLRVDSLSQILSSANIMSGVNVAIMDTLQGMVLGSVMERMGGVGKIVQFYPGSDLNRQIFHYFNFPSEFQDNIYNYPLKKLPELQSLATSVECLAKQTKEPLATTTSDSMEERSERSDSTTSGVNGSKTGSESGVKMDEMIVETTKNVGNEQECSGTSHNNLTNETKGCKRKRTVEDEKAMLEKSKRLDFVKNFILEKKFDCLIIACKHHVTPIVLALLEYVAPSRPFVIFSAHKEPLVDCYQSLKKRGGVLSLRLTETWYREYQVLPARTHPTMQMTGTGGYLLTGTTVM